MFYEKGILFIEAYKRAERPRNHIKGPNKNGAPKDLSIQFSTELSLHLKYLTQLVLSAP